MQNKVKISFRPNQRKYNNKQIRIGSRPLKIGENMIKAEALEYPVIQTLIEYGIIEVLEVSDKESLDKTDFDVSEDVEEKVEKAATTKAPTKRSSTKKSASVAS